MNGKNAKLARKAADEAAALTSRVAGEAMMQVVEYARRIELKVNTLEEAVNRLEAKVFPPVTDEQ